MRFHQNETDLLHILQDSKIIRLHRRTSITTFDFKTTNIHTIFNFSNETDLKSELGAKLPADLFGLKLILPFHLVKSREDGKIIHRKKSILPPQNDQKCNLQKWLQKWSMGPQPTDLGVLRFLTNMKFNYKLSSRTRQNKKNYMLWKIVINVR